MQKKYAKGHAGSLLDVTRTLLANRSRALTLDEIAGDTGLPTHWLHSFALHRVPDPSVNRVQTLYEYLTGTPLVQISVSGAKLA